MILNLQNRVSFATGPLEVFLSRIRRKLGLRADSFSVCFVSQSAIARWNRTYRGKSGPTDVLSFPADRARGPAAPKQGSRRVRKPGKATSTLHAQKRNGITTGGYLGDIAISPDTARRNARRFGRTLDGELRALILHGVLHLLGYDHETDHGEMDRRERRLRRELGLS
jgi:probable rRNA maturation factor